MRYGQRNYNDQRYNIDGVVYISSLTESVTGTDATQLSETLKVLFDSLTVADATIALMANPVFFDLLFLDATLQIQFSNKALSDTVRLADWLSIERTPAQNNWYD